MGNFVIAIEAAGAHGQAREVPTGGPLPPFNRGTPEAKALDAIAALRGLGCTITRAEFVHWPNTPECVVDDLLAGRRITGQFAEAPRGPEASEPEAPRGPKAPEAA